MLSTIVREGYGAVKDAGICLVAGCAVGIQVPTWQEKEACVGAVIVHS